MQYIRQSLTPDEELIHIGRFHWIYSVNAVMAIVYGVGLAITVLVTSVYFLEHFWSYINHGVGYRFQSHMLIGKMRELHPAIKLLAVFMALLGLLRFAQIMIVQATTEIAVTSVRLVYKRGLVARYVGEMSIDRIEGVNVLQTFWGRIFNYGRLMVRGMGVGEVILPTIANPILFRKAIERARARNAKASAK